MPPSRFAITGLFWIGALAFGTGARVVESNGGFQPVDPSVPGEAYVGQVNGASGVYLGGGFVLTAGHVGAGDFTLGGQTYYLVAGSAQAIGNADLSLFRVFSPPALQSLTLALDPPVPDSTPFDLLGFGGNAGETYGQDTVTQIDQPVPLFSFNSVDFFALLGTYGAGPASYTNDAVLVGGDSGGGDFAYNPVSGGLELIGLNEAILTDDTTGDVVGSAFVQVSDYSTIITADIATAAPEPPAWLLLAGGLAGLVLVSGIRRLKRA